MDHDPLHTPLPSRRWRVLLVRVAPEDLERVVAALPTPRELILEELPIAVRVTGSHDDALRSAHRLRTAGGVVLLVEEEGSTTDAAFCTRHPGDIANTFCHICQRPICGDCRAVTGGEPLCADHAFRYLRRKRNIRLRQLFMVFLFAVFLYEVNRFLETDRVALDPSGTVRVAMLQFVPPEWLGAPIVRQLNTATPEDGTNSLADIAPFFSAERNRYRGQEGRYLDIDLLGPWAEDLHPPELARGQDSLFKGMWASYSYARYFRGLAADHGIDLDQYGVKVFVIYGDEDEDLASHSRGSEKARLAISFISAQERSPAYAVLTVAHELAHALGAEDNYDPNRFQATYPEGFVEPFATPLYPQRFAELMALDIPIAPGLDVEVRDMSQVRVGHYSAARMGWIGAEQARLYYTPPTIRPEDQLPERKARPKEGPPPPPASP